MGLRHSTNSGDGLPLAAAAMSYRRRPRIRLSEASRAGLIAAGVNGRFGARRAATAPGLASDTVPTLVPEKTAAIASIDAAQTLERKRASMAQAGLARGAAPAPTADGDTLPVVDGGSLAEGGLAVERTGALEVQEELA